MNVTHSYSIPSAELVNVYEKLHEAVLEFEHLYYQRRLERLNFIPQSMHALTRLASEIVRVGSLAAVAQWPLERTIGDLESEIHQHSKQHIDFYDSWS